ncbi:MAG: hypothetical protein ACKVS8_12070 [Phycisphaerales bacterium]
MLISPLEFLGGAIPILSPNNGAGSGGGLNADPATNLNSIASALTTGDLSIIFGLEPETDGEAAGPSAMDFANSLAQLKAQASAASLAQLLTSAALGTESESSIFAPLGLKFSDNPGGPSATALAGMLNTAYGPRPSDGPFTFNLLG